MTTLDELLVKLRELAVEMVDQQTNYVARHLQAEIALTQAADALEAAARENERLTAENYKTFTDGMEAAAEICGSLAETTYDDTDAFEAATGCEAAIMSVVKEQRAQQRSLGRTT